LFFVVNSGHLLAVVVQPGFYAQGEWKWRRADLLWDRRTDAVFVQRKTLLEPFGLTRYSTDSWGAYTRHLEPDMHRPGTRNTQQIERTHLTLRTRMKRLVRKTVVFQKWRW